MKMKSLYYNVKRGDVMKKEKNYLYDILKVIYTFLLKLLFKPTIYGKENIISRIFNPINTDESIIRNNNPTNDPTINPNINNQPHLHYNIFL